MKPRLLLFASLVGALVCGALAVASLPVAAQEAETDKEDKTTTAALPEREVSNRIDAEIRKIWQRDDLKPARASTDEEFVRRVYLDTIGLPPTADEVVAFLKDDGKDKRRKLIDKLVADERFGEHLGDMWSNILLGRSARDANGASHLLAIWIAERVNAGHSFSDIIYDVVTADGKLSENPAVAVYSRERPFNTANAAGLVTKNLMGVQIQCAECHDHPYEEAWTEGVFDGMASYWSAIQVRANLRNLPVNPTITENPRVPRIRPEALERLPEGRRKAMERVLRYSKPVTLDGKPTTSTDRRLWRPAVAKWMVGKENKQTANYIANRFWSFALGIGLLNPVDDFNSFNEASHPELLAFLGQDLIDNNYNIKRLYRAILNSSTYQLSSAGKPDKAELWHFAAYPVRQLSPEQFFGTFVQIAGSAGSARDYRRRVGTPADQVKRRYEAGKRRMQRESDNPNAREFSFNEEALAQFVAWFEKMGDTWFLRRSMAAGYARLSSDDEMNEMDGFSLTIDQALLVMNGDVTNNLSGSQRGTLLWKITNEVKDDDSRLEQLYLTVLSRRPTTAETRDMKTYIKESKNAAQAYEDIMFALLASTEFATNH